MKLSSFIACLTITCLHSACGGSGSQEKLPGDSSAVETSSAQSTPAEGSSTPTSSPASAKFDFNSVPVSDKALGAFPFFSMPAGTKAQKGIERRFDKLFFPIDGIMTAFEGRVYKVNVFEGEVDGKKEEWSQAYFEKSFDDAILAAGGQKIFDGAITKEEQDRYMPQANYLGEDGSIGYASENIKVYLIRQKNGDDVLIQLSSNNAAGKLNILQKKPFEQTITMLSAEQIGKDLTEKGKAVLHINFDTDKATLLPDGQKAVAEIARTLKTDPALNIAINGYTDNTGADSRNLQLSKDRAETVRKEIVAAGIDSKRLSADGFGSASPLASNDKPEGKAQNRRVELIKK